MADRRFFVTGLLVALTLPPLTGCADWSYRKIQLGQAPQDYGRVLPAETSRRTALGLCHLSGETWGQTEAIVVLLTSDRRVAGKLRARYLLSRWGLGPGEPGYQLEGELDPELYGIQGAGPLDALRAIASELIDYRGEKLALEAHAWIAVGLTRLMQRWPGVAETSAVTERLREALEMVPGGGAARIEVDERGVYHVEYRQGNIR
jgi:hypothetical protein